MLDTSDLRKNINAPAFGGFAVTKSDTTRFDGVGTNPTTPRALWVGGAGDLALTMFDGTTVTLVGVPAGTRLDVAVLQVKAATTATNIVALY